MIWLLDGTFFVGMFQKKYVVAVERLVLMS